LLGLVVGSLWFLAFGVLSFQVVRFLGLFFGYVGWSLCILVVYLEALCAVRVCVSALLLCNYVVPFGFFGIYNITYQKKIISIYLQLFLTNHKPEKARGLRVSTLKLYRHA
jgi:hypothetical protein